MSDVLLNYGLILDKFKLKERKKLFKNFEQFYFFPNYIPDSKTNTIYYFDDDDIKKLHYIYGSNLKIFYYEELYSQYILQYKQYVNGVKNSILFEHKNKFEILNDLQEVLNEYVYFKEFIKLQNRPKYTVLSNSFRFYDENMLKYENSFYYNKILYSKDLKKRVNYDIAYGYFNIDNEKFKKLIDLSSIKFNHFFDNSDKTNSEEYFDFDAERIRYEILKELNLQPMRLNLKKTYFRNFKTFGRKPTLNKVKIGCGDLLGEMYDL